MMRKQEEITSKPGVLATIAQGFDLTSKHPWLLLLPALLDIFYWLGPRLSLQPLIAQLAALAPQEGPIVAYSALLLELAPRTNLFTTLTVRFIGVPALMVGVAPAVTPLSPRVFELTSWAVLAGLLAAFALLGLLLTAVYYTLIAQALHRQAHDGPPLSVIDWGPHVGRTWRRLVGLMLVFIVNALAVYTPLAIVGGLLMLLNSFLGLMVLMIGPVALFWLVVLMSLAPAGVAVNGRPLWPALVESVRLVYANWIPTLTLLLAIVAISTLLDWLLVLADTGGWLTLANIFGHAFVSTALAAALFIFYRDRFALAFRKQNV